MTLNLAVAVGERDGPAGGLALVDEVDGLAPYPWWHASTAELLRRLGRPAEARSDYERALGLDMNDAQAEYLRAGLASLPAAR